MLDRMSVTALLKSVIAIMASCVVIVLARSAWQSWESLEATGRISIIADVSTNAFKAMHHLRTDRSSASRVLASEDKIGDYLEKYIRNLREEEMPALRATAILLAPLEFPDKAELVQELSQQTEKLTALHAEFWDAVAKPKAQRRPTLAKDFDDTEVAVLAVLEKISNRLAVLVNHANPVIDQLLSIKQMAWILRSAGGDAATLVSNGFGPEKITPETQLKFTKYIGGINVAWLALEASASGMQLPPALASALTTAKATYVDSSYTSVRDHVFNALAAGQKPELTSNQWTPLNVDSLNTAVAVAETALESAKDYGTQLYQAAERDLIMQLAFLVIALGLAVLSMTVVSRRVTKPLQVIQGAMLKVAGGDLDVDIPFMQRRDEIGALAGALGTFRQNAVEKERIEDEQRERSARGASRQRAIEAYIAAFESQVRETLDALTRASDEMRQTSDTMSAIADQTTSQVQMVAQASSNASANVQSVAAASEELSASINDISHQATHAATIANRAVEQARRTDVTVKGLSDTASRIGAVVNLINEIAGQTNLLALNATIEAARAGDAGRGFAVVASEVKTLSSQTAKATEEITQQILAVQNVAQDAMDAIRGIGGTISEVNEVATAIAAAVEEQGAATQEITRNTQQAAQGTRNVSENIGGVTEGADATGMSAQNVKLAADALGTQAQQLRGQVNDFLGKIRAA